jgi:hypothetical protein
VANYLPTYTGNLVSLTGPVITTANITGGNILTAGLISATGNITGNYFIGNGSQLTGIVSTYGNANVVANLAALGSNPVSTTGNITGNYFIGNGSQLTGIAGTYSNADVANYLPTYSGNLVSLTGPVITTANITGGNILTGGLISATANITGNYFIGNGSALTGITATGGATTFSNTAPVSPAIGDVWIQANTAVQYIYFNDTTSNQWAEMEAYQSFNSAVSSSSSFTWNIANSNITMTASNGYFVDTTGGAKTMTLPASAVIGDTIRINDLAGTFGANNLTVGRNSSNIQGVAQDLVVSINQSSFGLVYSNSTYGWKLLEL